MGRADPGCRMTAVQRTRSDMALSPYKQLEQEWKRLHALNGAMSLLRWDAAVMMPRGSAGVRGEQLAALETEYHALLISPRVSRLLERAQAGSGMLEDWEIANLREMRRQFPCSTPGHFIGLPAAHNQSSNLSVKGTGALIGRKPRLLQRLG